MPSSPAKLKSDRAYRKRHADRINAKRRRLRREEPDHPRRQHALADMKERYAEAMEERPDWVRRRALGWRLRKLGADLDAYDAMVKIQGDRCAICRTKDKGRVGGREGRGQPAYHWAIDHDHATGEIRALLCKRCNTALGGFGDDPARLRAAAEYLEAYG